MLRTLLICANETRRHVIQSAADDTRLVRIVDSFEHYPDGNSLTRILSRFGPAVVIVDGQDLELGLASAATVRRQSPGAAILGVNASRDRYGPLRESIPVTIPYPPDVELLSDGLSVAVHKGETRHIQNLIAFLPAKAGAGSSTVAFNTAAAMAAAGRRVLLIDADLRSGVLSFMLSCLPVSSMQLALEAVSEEETLTWSTYCTRAHDIESATARYDTVLVDLPELVNPATVEVVKSACHVMVVTTQEVLCLKMAQRRERELVEWGVPDDRVKVLVNRWHKQEINKEEIEKFLKRPVFTTFPNDFPGVRKATLAGAPVAPSSSLGQSFQAFVQKLSGAKVQTGWLAKLRGS
jgi:Mrp family chromosome partitioning ATPase